MGIMRINPYQQCKIECVGKYVPYEDDFDYNTLYIMNSRGDLCEMPVSELEELNVHRNEEFNKLKAENKRLKDQLKDLREVVAKLEKLFPEPKNEPIEVNIPRENLEEKILQVKSRTLCDSSVARDYLERCNYDVEAAITAINWSNINGVPSVIL